VTGEGVILHINFLEFDCRDAVARISLHSCPKKRVKSYGYNPTEGFTLEIQSLFASAALVKKWTISELFRLATFKCTTMYTGQ